VLGRLREHTAAACARAREAADAVRRVQHLEVLYQLADDVALAPDIQLVVERLAPAVRAAAGAELIDVFLCDAAASRLFGTHAARGSLARLLGRWRRAPRARIREDGGLLVVPMLLDGALVGVVRVRPLGPLEPAEEQLLQTIADGLGEMVSRTCLRDRVAAADRELAVADERERIARDLHDTLGQMHFAVRTELGELARAAAGSPYEARLAALEDVVGRADTELRQAIHALSFLGRDSHGLVPSVRALVRRVRDEQRLDVRLKLAGTPVALPPDQEEALYRLVREALTNVVRHARATYANVTVSFEDGCVRVDIRDDGTGLVLRPGGANGLHFGLRSMQRRLAEVGGELHVRNRSPHGVVVSGWVSR
jgi:signal transduction histidine kinase